MSDGHFDIHDPNVAQHNYNRMEFSDLAYYYMAKIGSWWFDEIGANGLDNFDQDGSRKFKHKSLLHFRKLGQKFVPENLRQFRKVVFYRSTKNFSNSLLG